MGNIIRSFTSGFTNVISDLFSSPLHFLAGKSCSSVCGSTWDFICYIENLCIANLLKLAMVMTLFYSVLLFFYLLYKLGIYTCIGHSLCKMVWGCLVSWLSFWAYCCTFFCNSLIMLKSVSHDHRTRDRLSEFDTSKEDYYDDYHVPIRRSTMEVSRSSLSRGMRDCRRAQLRKSLRPRSHRIRGIELSAESSEYGYGRSQLKHGNYGRAEHKIRVIHSSKFARKGTTHFRPKIYSGRVRR